MRTPAFRPEVAGCLEDRALLSAGPVVLSHQRLAKTADLIHLGFQLYAQDRDVSGLHSEINKGVVMIPFARVDGLGVSINRIVRKMQHDLSERIPHAMRTARREVLDAVLTGVETRVRAGDVVVLR